MRGRPLKHYFSHGGIYLICTFLGSVSPLLILPSVTTMHGADGWHTLAVAQGFGGLLSVLLDGGWILIGPQAVAARSKQSARQIMAIASNSKIFVLAIILLLSVPSTWLLFQEWNLTGYFGILSTATIGLLPGWFFVGRGQPKFILLGEAMPRVIAAMAGAALLMLTGHLWLAPLGLCVGNLLSFGAAWCIVVGRRPIRKVKFVQGLGPLMTHSSAIWSRVFSTSYSNLVPVVLNVVAPGSVAAFSGVDRSYRLVLTVFQPAFSVMQPVVGRTSEQKLNRTLIRLGAATAVLGVAASLLFVIIAPLLSKYLFSGTLVFGPELIGAGGLVILVIMLSRFSGNIFLVRKQRIKSVAISALVGGVVGLPAIWLLAANYGAVGAIYGVVIAEVTVLIVQLAGVVKIGNHREPEKMLVVSK